MENDEATFNKIKRKLTQRTFRDPLKKSYWSFKEDIIAQGESKKPEEIHEFFSQYDYQNYDIIVKFVERIKDYSQTIDAGETYYRARKPKLREEGYQGFRHCDGRILGYDSSGSMMHTRPQANRANIKGKECIYLAGQPYTAIAEVDPGQLEFISIAKIKLTDELKLVDLYYSGRINDAGLDEEKITSFEIACILSWAFSEPVIDEPEIEYLPTQFLAYLIKESGYEGIRYESLKNPGDANTALFSQDKLQWESSEVVRCYSKTFKLEGITSPGQQYLAEKDKMTPQDKIEDTNRRLIKEVADLYERSNPANYARLIHSIEQLKTGAVREHSIAEDSADD